MPEKQMPIFDIETNSEGFSSVQPVNHHHLEADFINFEEKTGKQQKAFSLNSFLSSNFTRRKYRVALALGVVFFLILLSRIFYLQIVKGGRYARIAEGNRIQIIPIPSERGLIYDRNGVLLTQNIPKFSVAIIPQSLPRNKDDREHVIKKLSVIIGVPEEEINKTLLEYESYQFESIVILENVDYDKALVIQIAAGEMPGVIIQRGSKRLYGEEEKSVFTTSTKILSLSHILGYESKIDKKELDSLYSLGYYPSDFIGKAGIEKSYENYLRGTYGKKRIEVNAYGREQSVLAEIPPVAGSNLHLTVDFQIQEQLENILNNILKKYGKKRASAVALDPRNGSILALVSLPAFDNNDFSGGIDINTYRKYTEDQNHPLFSRAISGTYPSGSTAKPAIAAAALQEGIITPNTSVLSTGGIKVGPWFFPDWKSGGHGITNVRKSLAWSVNTFYYYVGGGYNNFKGLGIEKIASYLRKFGFSNKLGIDVPGESSGFVPSPDWKQEVKKEKWYVGDTYNLSIGQGDLLVTPLQIAAMTATIANHGTLYWPHLVNKIENPTKKSFENIQPKVLNKEFIDQKNIDVIRLGMRDCVLSGSCARLAYLPIATAGKTGTAQWGSNKDPHAWYTSFAPFDSPEIVLTVQVEEGKEGSSLAAPVAEEFYKWWANYHPMTKKTNQPH